ncbi:MAG: hypothetical protein AAGG48_04850 [Planctomycetota bacterium]
MKTHTETLLDTIESLLALQPTETLHTLELNSIARHIADCVEVRDFVHAVVKSDVYSRELSSVFEECNASAGLPAVRVLRSTLALGLGQFTKQVAVLIRAFDPMIGSGWLGLASRIQTSRLASWKTIDFFKHGRHCESYCRLEETLVVTFPHAMHRVSPFRDCYESLASGWNSSRRIYSGPKR